MRHGTHRAPHYYAREITLPFAAQSHYHVFLSASERNLWVEAVLYRAGQGGRIVVGSAEGRHHSEHDAPEKVIWHYGQEPPERVKE